MTVTHTSRRTSQLLFQEFAPFAFEDLRGQIYWFRDPASICNPDSPRTDGTAEGIWIRMPQQTFKLPPSPDFPNVGFNTDSHWTKHLCVVGMGTHYQYGMCTSQYQFTVLYDANDSLVGVVNALNLKSELADISPAMETTPASGLMGLVFNESRFDSWFCRWTDLPS